jgi:tripartite-type tricarboxylate transporter receptor subunit TctC
MKKILALAFGLALTWMMGVSAIAAPKDTVIVVGFAPGGTSSAVAHFLADSLERMTKSPVIVENHKGASGLVAAEYVRRQKPDGKTLLLMSSTSSLAIPPSPELAYIGLIATYKYVFVTGKQNPATSDEYFAAAQHRDAFRSVATAGAGTLPHLIASALFGERGIPMVHVPFAGSAPAILSVVGGHVASAVVPYPDLVSQADSVRVLAQTGDGIDLEGWVGILAPAGIPTEEIVRLQDLLRRASADAQARLESLGFRQEWKPGAVLRSMHRNEYDRFKHTVP